MVLQTHLSILIGWQLGNGVEEVPAEPALVLEGKAILMLRARSTDQTARMCSQSSMGERVDGDDEK